jgi:tetratricopeptide (TPR) repeat protein
MWLSVAAAALVAELTLSADPPEPKNPPAGPPAAPADEKIQTADQAAARLRDLLADLAKADEDKLEFDEAKTLFAKLAPIWPLADQLDEKTKPQFLISYAATSLAAGEPDAALAAYKALFDCKHVKLENDGLYRRAFFAACIAGDADGAKQMLGKLDLGAAKEMTRNSDLIGKKLPPFRLELLDGHTLRCPAEDRVLVLTTWAALPKDAQRQFTDAVKTFQDKYRKHDALTVVGINLNPPEDKAKVIQCIKAEDLGRWLHVLEGRPDGLLTRSFGMVGQIGPIVVIGPDNRVLFKGTPGDSPAPWAVAAGLRQIEKKQAKAKADQPKPTSRPAVPAGPAVTHPAPPPTTRPTVAEDRPEQMLNLAQTYRAGGLNDKADEMLRKIIADYPTSPAADQARKTLAGGK